MSGSHDIIYNQKIDRVVRMNNSDREIAGEAGPSRIPIYHPKDGEAGVAGGKGETKKKSFINGYPLDGEGNVTTKPFLNSVLPSHPPRYMGVEDGFFVVMWFLYSVTCTTKARYYKFFFKKEVHARTFVLVGEGAISIFKAPGKFSPIVLILHPM